MAEVNEDFSHPYIKHLLLQNFMCHQNFEINLGKRLNLICGTNGSGKSTILTALMVALGCRAKTTSRSESLGSLVKTGASRSWIHVKLHVPPEYHEIFNKYGNEVTVTRIIGAKGDSVYQLRDSTGRKLPKGGVSDVRVLCYHFGFYPDNELAMLSQENAKEFLVHASVHTKYEKLQRALLQHIIFKNQQAVTAAESDHQSMLQHMREREQNIDILEARSKEILNRASEQKARKQRIHKIKNILEWREVDDNNQRYEEAEKTLQRERDALEALRSVESHDTQNLLDAKVTELQESMTKLAELKDQISSEINSLERKRHDLNYTVQRSREDVALFEDGISRHEQEISELRDKAENHSPEILERKRDNLEQKKSYALTKLAEAADKRSQSEQTIAELQSQSQTHQHRMKMLRMEATELQTKIQSLTDEHRRISSGDSNNFRKNPLHDRHKKLQQLVNSQSSWQIKPLGPLYEYIEMNDEGANYTPALERLWNQTLDCWWVQTESDRVRLEQLASNLNFKGLRIILRKDDTFNFSSALPPASNNYKRVVDVLLVDSDPIKRILVDLNHIEAMVMVDGTRSAFQAIQTDNRIRNALAISTTQRGKAQFTQVTVARSRTDAATVRGHDLVRIKVGVKARCNQILLDIEELKSQLSIINERIGTCRQQLDSVELKIQEEQRNIMKTVNIERKFEEVISDTSKAIHNIDVDVGLQDYTLDIKRLEDSIEQKRKDLEESMSVLSEFEATLRDSDGQLKAKSSQLKEISDNIAAHQQNLKELESRSRKAEAEHQQRRRKIARASALVENMEGNLRSHQELIDEVVAKTIQNVGPRIAEEDTENSFTDAESLQRELRKLTSETQILMATDEEIEKAQIDARNALDARAHIETNRREMEELSTIIENRRKVRQENETRAWKNIKIRIKSAFCKMLRRRKFHGDVTIDDEKKRLIVEVAPESNASRTVSTLSGGEKSFTQVALLMAVWEAMQVGLVAMDEYDVFMDKANRSMSLRLLGETISRHSMQCILITPQDVDTSALQGIEFEMHKLSPARS